MRLMLVISIFTAALFQFAAGEENWFVEKISSQGAPDGEVFSVDTSETFVIAGAENGFYSCEIDNPHNWSIWENLTIGLDSKEISCVRFIPEEGPNGMYFYGNVRNLYSSPGLISSNFEGDMSVGVGSLPIIKDILYQDGLIFTASIGEESIFVDGGNIRYSGDGYSKSLRKGSSSPFGYFNFYSLVDFKDNIFVGAEVLLVDDNETDGSVQFSTDLGATWIGALGIDKDIFDLCVHKGSLYASGTDENSPFCLFKTESSAPSKNGSDWDFLRPPNVDVLTAIADAGDRLYAGCDDGRIFYTKDEGETWIGPIATDETLGRINEMCFNEWDNSVFIAAKNGLFRIYDRADDSEYDITVCVVDCDSGDPIVDATVSLREILENIDQYNEERKTGADGCVTFENFARRIKDFDNFEYKAYALIYCEEVDEIVQTETAQIPITRDTTFRVCLDTCGSDPEKYSISGTVTECETKEAVPDVKIDLYLGGALTDTDSSNVAGEYEFLDLPPGDYELVYSSDGCNFESNSIPVELIDKDIDVDNCCDTPPPDTYSISGTVSECETKEAVPDVKIDLYLGGALTDTDSSNVAGEYEFLDLPPDDYELVFSSDGCNFENNSIPVELIDEDIDVDNCCDTPPPDTYSISGTVTECATKEAVPDVKIDLYLYGELIDTDISNVAGEYEFFDLLPGDYELAYSSDGCNFESNPIVVKLVDADTAVDNCCDADIPPDTTITLTVRVLSSCPPETPIPDAEVELNDSDGGMIKLNTNDEGIAIFEDIAPGLIGINASKSGFIPASFDKSFDVDDTIEIVLHPETVLKDLAIGSNGTEFSPDDTLRLNVEIETYCDLNSDKISIIAGFELTELYPIDAEFSVQETKGVMEIREGITNFLVLVGANSEASITVDALEDEIALREELRIKTPQLKYILAEPFVPRIEYAAPNPCESEIVFGVRTYKQAEYRLSLIDDLGREVEILFNSELAPGFHELSTSTSAPSGSYRAVLQSDAGQNSILILIYK